MTYTETELKGVWIIEPKVFNDDRGYFFESWNSKSFTEHIGAINFVQDNESKSSYGVYVGYIIKKVMQHKLNLFVLSKEVY